MKRIIKRVLALQDLEDIATFIGQTSPQAATRFLEAAERAFEALLKMPGLGSAWETPNPRYADLRCWPIRGFKRYLVFYRAIEEGIEIVRVLQSSRDLHALFDGS